MESFINHLLITVLAILIFSIGWYIGSLLKRDMSIVDISWGIGYIVIILVQILYVLLESSLTVTQILVSMLVIIWGVRLTWHIARRNWGKGEDYRYARWRKRWMKKGQVYFLVRSYLQVFLFQGLLTWIISLPSMIAFHKDYETSPFLIIMGATIWIIGFLFEAIGDAQLTQFIRYDKKKSGDIMTRGLWKYTRHPNYFGEALLWWGPALIVFPLAFGFLGLISPLLIGYLVYFVSGVPILEKRYADNAAYQAYAQHTPKFFPFIPSHTKKYS